MFSLINVLLFIISFYIIKSNINKYYSYIIKLLSSSSNELNGPIPIPVIGNLHQLGSKPHHTCQVLAQHYGKIYRMWFGDYYTVILSDYEIIKQLYLNHHDSFKERPITPSFRLCSDNQNGILLSNEKWDRNRQLIQQVMKKANVKDVYEMIDGQIDDLIPSVQNYVNSGEPLPVRLFATRFTLSTMLKYLFNETISYDEDLSSGTVSMFAECLEHIFVLADAGHIGDYIKLIQPLYYQYLKLTDVYIPRSREFVNQKYIEHLNNQNSNNQSIRNDLLDLLIKEIGTSDKNSVRDIIANCLDLLVAGTDTAAKAIEWILLRLVNHQDVQEKAYQEIVNIIGNDNSGSSGKIKLTDRPRTPYINAVCKEALRCHTITPFGIPRVLNKDITINGKLIPKDSQVVINYRALHHDPDYFENPNEFNPDRFINGSDTSAYIPFSLGQRKCVGIELANNESYLFITNLLLNYKVTSTNNQPLSLNENFGINIKPDSYKINLYKR